MSKKLIKAPELTKAYVLPHHATSRKIQVNQWVIQHPHLKTVIIEKLNFQNPALSKKLNRMIQNFGLSRIKSKLTELGLLYEFQVFHLSTSYKVACR